MQKNAELAEKSNKKLGTCNIIHHGVVESNNKDNVTRLEVIKPSTACKSIFRIGKEVPNKRRPIKLVMKSEEDENKIMDNLKCLKDQETFKGLSVTDDYTIIERELIRKWTEKVS